MKDSKNRISKICNVGKTVEIGFSNLVPKVSYYLTIGDNVMLVTYPLIKSLNGRFSKPNLNTYMKKL